MSLADCLVIGLTWILAVGLGLFLREARDARHGAPVVVRTDLRVAVPITVTPTLARLPDVVEGDVADAEPVCAASGCSQPLSADNPQQIYCSHACRQAAYRERRAA